MKDTKKKPREQSGEKKNGVKKKWVEILSSCCWSLEEEMTTKAHNLLRIYTLSNV